MKKLVLHWTHVPAHVDGYAEINSEVIPIRLKVGVFLAYAETVFLAYAETVFLALKLLKDIEILKVTPEMEAVETTGCMI